jgi:hypothetical protein
MSISAVAAAAVAEAEFQQPPCIPNSKRLATLGTDCWFVEQQAEGWMRIEATLTHDHMFRVADNLLQATSLLDYSVLQNMSIQAINRVRWSALRDLLTMINAAHLLKAAFYDYIRDATISKEKKGKGFAYIQLMKDTIATLKATRYTVKYARGVNNKNKEQENDDTEA